MVGKAWLSLEELTKPGSTELTSRVYLETCAPITKKANSDGTEEEVEEETFEKCFEEAKTYVHLKISLDTPIVPESPANPEPQPDEIVPAKQFITWPYSKDPCDDFGK